MVTFHPVLNPEGRTLNPRIGDAGRLLQAGVAAGLLLLLCLAPARAATPLYEEDPYDQVVLDAANHHAVLKVKPLNLPDRQLPVRHKPDEKLVVHLLDKPDAAYEVAWRSIAKIEVFEQLVLDKAGALVADGKFDEAYDYFKFLEQNRPNTPGLGKAMEEYLYEEAKQSHREQHYDETLALLKELHRRNPQRPGLDKALGVTTDKLIDRYATAKDYAAARALLRGLAAEYPDHPVVAQWEQRLKEQAAGLLAKTQAAADAGRLPEAAALSRDLVRVMADPGYRDASAIVPVVLLGFVAWASVNVFEIGALLRKKTWLRTLSSLAAAGAAMIAYAILIPRWGAMGAAWATVIGFAVMSSTSYVFSRRARRIPYDLRRAGKLMALGATVYGASALVPGIGLDRKSVV